MNINTNANLLAYEEALHEWEVGACGHPGTFEEFVATLASSTTQG